MICTDFFNKKGADFRKSTPDLGLLLMDQNHINFCNMLG